MKNSSDTVGNRTRALPVCSTVPQPTAPPRALLFSDWHVNNLPIPVAARSKARSLAARLLGLRVRIAGGMDVRLL
jgi:hypothetical protein